MVDVGVWLGIISAYLGLFDFRLKYATFSESRGNPDSYFTYAVVLLVQLYMSSSIMFPLFCPARRHSLHVEDLDSDFTTTLLGVVAIQIQRAVVVFTRNHVDAVDKPNHRICLFIDAFWRHFKISSAHAVPRGPSCLQTPCINKTSSTWSSGNVTKPSCAVWL